MVYIIGIDHLVQYNGPLPGNILAEFRELLVEKTGEYSISVIAEEFNAEFLHDVYNATEDTALAAAGEAGVDHIYCDPDEAERDKLGIPYYADVRDMVMEKHGISGGFIFDDEKRKMVELETAAEVKKFWHLRESFWLEKLRSRLCGNILFLCGHEHVDRFRALLETEGVEVSVVDPFWRRDLFTGYGKLFPG